MSTEQLHKKILFFLERNIDFSPWNFMLDEEANENSIRLRKKYNWCIYPFARNGDDFACLVTDGKLEGKFIILHDFAEPGWEFRAGNEMENFGTMLDTMLTDALEMIEAD